MWCLVWMDTASIRKIENNVGIVIFLCTDLLYWHMQTENCSQSIMDVSLNLQLAHRARGEWLDLFTNWPYTFPYPPSSFHIHLSICFPKQASRGFSTATAFIFYSSTHPAFLPSLRSVIHSLQSPHTGFISHPSPPHPPCSDSCHCEPFSRSVLGCCVRMGSLLLCCSMYMSVCPLVWPLYAHTGLHTRCTRTKLTDMSSKSQKLKHSLSCTASARGESTIQN